MNLTSVVFNTSAIESELIDSELVDSLFGTYDEVKPKFNYNKSLIKIEDNATLDILHEIELTELDDAQCVVLLRRLQDVRIRRRIAKDENLVLAWLLKSCSQCRSKEDKDKQMLKNYKSLLKTIENRVYKPKVGTSSDIDKLDVDSLVREQQVGYLLKRYKYDRRTRLHG